MTSAQQILDHLKAQSDAIAALSVSVKALQDQMAASTAEQAQADAIDAAIMANTAALPVIPPAV